MICLFPCSESLLYSLHKNQLVNTTLNFFNFLYFLNILPREQIWFSILQCSKLIAIRDKFLQNLGKYLCRQITARRIMQ